jgi:hypothetical protein
MSIRSACRVILPGLAASLAGLSLGATGAVAGVGSGPVPSDTRTGTSLNRHVDHLSSQFGLGSNGAGPLIYGGGPVQKTPKVYLTYWGWHGNDPKGVKPYIENFFNGVGGSSWANIQTQYTGAGQGNITNPTGQLAGTWADDSTTPNIAILDGDIANEALKAENHFGYSPDADYFVLTPTGTGTIGFKVQYCAWHSSTTDSSGRTIAFTNQPYMPDAGSSCGQNYVNPGSAGVLDGVSIVGGHEYAETVTDPQPSSGWVDATGAENGDKCAWIRSGSGASQNISLATGKFAVQSLWSNAAGLTGDCVISY